MGGGLMMVAGIDLSTRALHCAVLPIDEDVEQCVALRSVNLSKHPDASQLYRDVRQAVQQLLISADGCDVSWVVVEAPRGPYAVRQLNGVYGAVCASVPRSLPYTGLEPLEWRRALKLPARLSKPAAIDAAYEYLVNETCHTKRVNEHEADAILVALAGRRLLADHYRQEVAA